LSQTDSDVPTLARIALQRLGEELELSHLDQVGDDFDIFAALDSFAIVELLMTTESVLEEATGSYFPLANEKIFDAENSPLQSFDRWVAHIEEQRARA